MTRTFFHFTCISAICGLFFITATGQSITGIEMKSSPLLAYQSTIQNERVQEIEYPSVAADRFNREVLDYINEMRRDPGAFYKQYVEKYIKEKNERFTATYTHSLKKAMLRSPALPLFKTSVALEKTATLQLNYLSRFGGRKLTHEQGNIGFAERMKRAGLHCLAENLYTDDNPNPLNVVLDLLIDQNIPSFGHRKNLMNPMYTGIGIVNARPKGGRTIVVMDFGCTP